MPVTYIERDADTVEFFPVTTPFPNFSIDDYLQQAATDIPAILQEPNKSIPSLQYGSKVINAYIQLVQILRREKLKPIDTREPRVCESQCASRWITRHQDTSQQHNI